MCNILDDLDISSFAWKNDQILPLWVYGTLRGGQRFNYYLMGCSDRVDEYRMNGTLMLTGSGDVFVRKGSADAEEKVMGELFHISLVGLMRIFHLENKSGSFPKAYDLDVSEVFNVKTGKSEAALWFRRWEEKPLGYSDYCTYKLQKTKTLLEDLVEFINKPRKTNLGKNDLDGFLREELMKIQFGRSVQNK